MSVGIVSYSVYIPQLRIKTADIANFWGKDGESVEKGLGLAEKSVPFADEDAVTMAVEASFRALQTSNVLPEQIKALSVGSESHPYAVKPTSTIVGELLGLPHHYLAVDTQFACKAATAAMRLLSMMDEISEDKFGLVIGSDTAQAKLGDALEYIAASAAVAFLLGKGATIADIIASTSYSSDTPDFWRRDGQKYPSHAGRFTGEPAYFSHVINASTHLLEKTNLKPSDFDYAVFHMPNGKFPKEAAKRLGFTKEQLLPGLLVEKMGNPYSASSLAGLALVLDQAKPHQKIFLCSYGSGSGSDAFVFETTNELKNFQRKNAYPVEKQIAAKRYITYQELLRLLSQKGYI